MRARLLALVLVPALVATFLVGSIARDRGTESEAATAVDETVGELTDLVDIRAELMLARVPVEVEVRASALGLDSQAALALLGLEPADLADFTDVRAALAQLPASQRPFTSVDLDRLQVAVASGTDAGALETFEALERVTDARFDAKLRELQDDIYRLGSPTLGRALRDLNAAATAASATGSMITGLADYWFSSFDGDASVEPARVELGVQMAAFEGAIGRLEASADPSVASTGASIGAIWRAGSFHTAIRDAIEGRPVAPFAGGGGVDLGLVVDTFTDSFELVGPQFELVTNRSEALAEMAQSQSSDALAVSRLTIALAVLMVATLLVLSLIVARSLGRPLRALIEGMRQVGRGELAVEPLPADGPREVSEASAAFNDVVLSLRLIEMKLELLADSDLDDPILAQALPGELGDALSRSVEVLSESIADRASLQDRLAHQATHDALTGIANRAGALDALQSALARAHRQTTTLAVAFLDLDGFKGVNDTFGHRAGDDVLCTVARRLVDTARTGDSCARLGGDEFIVIAEDVDGADGALAMARRIGAAIAQPMDADGHEVEIGASIGIALAGAGDDAPLDLVARADLAAYRAKRQGLGVALYEPERPDPVVRPIRKVAN